MRSHWAGPVWAAEPIPHLLVPVPLGSVSALEHSARGYLSISFSAPWATHGPFLLAHWPLANHSTPVPEPQRLGIT